MSERNLEVGDTRLPRKARDRFISQEAFSEWLRDRGYPDTDLLAEIVTRTDRPQGAPRRPTVVPKPDE